MHSRTSTLLAGGLLAVALAVLAIAVPVPLVALGPGPTFNTLADADGKPVVAVSGLPTYPTSGNLNMTTVSVTDRLTLVGALSYWAAPGRQVVPRSTVYQPGKTDAQVELKNAEDFTDSEINAESAAAKELAVPSVPAVADVVAGSAVDGKLRARDRLVSVNGTPVTSPESVNTVLQATKPGDTATVAFTRQGAPHTVTVTLGSAEGRAQGVLGVVLAVLPKAGDLTINLGGIGGPSAGLMFSLGIVDKLTPGSLTGGRFIAGTGAIDADGAVSNIGGIQFKMAAARSAGATVFLLPAGECAEAVAAAPAGLQLIKVGTLHDAVTALDDLNAGRAPATCS
ncbi:MAG TPA: PDZ domain-containing protein [Pseudonocardia sp.]